MPEWSIPAVLDVITATVPDREMVVWRDVRRTFAQRWIDRAQPGWWVQQGGKWVKK